MVRGGFNSFLSAEARRKTSLVLQFIRVLGSRARRLVGGVGLRIFVANEAEIQVAELDSDSGRLALAELPSPLSGGGFSKAGWRHLLRAALFAIRGGMGKPVREDSGGLRGLLKEAIRATFTGATDSTSWRDFASASVFSVNWLPRSGFHGMKDLGPFLAAAHVWSSKESRLPIESRFPAVKHRQRLQIRLQLSEAGDVGLIPLLLSEIETRVSYAGIAPSVWWIEVSRGRISEKLRAFGFREVCRFLHEGTALLEITHQDLEQRLRLWRSGPTNRRWFAHTRWMGESAKPSVNGRRAHHWSQTIDLSTEIC